MARAASPGRGWPDGGNMGDGVQDGAVLHTVRPRCTLRSIIHPPPLYPYRETVEANGGEEGRRGNQWGAHLRHSEQGQVREQDGRGR